MLNIARHFGLLALFAAALAAFGTPAGLGIGARFALYGALHAVALVLSLGPRATPTPGRRFAFIAIAAVLSLATARLGLFGLRELAGAGGSSGYLVVAGCAALGALAYGVSIGAVLANRASGGAAFDRGSLAARALGCAAATCAAFAVSRALHASGSLWLVLPWWFAFSGLLWCEGRRRA